MRFMIFVMLFLVNILVANEVRKPFVQFGHVSKVESVAITPDGKYIVSGGRDDTLKLWNLETGKEVRTFAGHTGWIKSIAITPDGKQALSGSHDKTLKLWNLKTGKEVRTFEGHLYGINYVTITPDGKYAL